MVLRISSRKRNDSVSKWTMLINQESSFSEEHVLHYSGMLNFKRQRSFFNNRVSVKPCVSKWACWMGVALPYVGNGQFKRLNESDLAWPELWLTWIRNQKSKSCHSFNDGKDVKMVQVWWYCNWFLSIALRTQNQYDGVSFFNFLACNPKRYIVAYLNITYEESPFYKRGKMKLDSLDFFIRYFYVFIWWGLT